MNQEMQLPFDDKFQLTLLELILSDKHVAEKSYVHLRPEFFPNEYFAKIFGMLKGLNELYEAAPSQNQLKNELLKITDPKQSQLYLDIYKRITNPQDFRDYEYTKKNLDSYFKSRNIFKLTNDIIKNQHLHPDKLTELIENHIKTISEISFNNVKTRGLENLLGFLDECKADAGNLIPTFLPTIDKALGGGCPRGTLAMAIGATNVGKSVWLINWTYKLIKAGYKVLYVNLEGYERQTMQRLICRAIRAPLYNVKNKILTEFQLDQVVNFQEECKENFKFFHNNSFDMTIESFIPALKHIVLHEFKADVVVYDYGQLFKSKKNHDGNRHEQAYCHRAITMMAGELDHLAVTVAQGQRDTNIKNSSASSLTRMTDIAECFEINRAAATVFTLNRSERDEEMEWIKILMDKQRDGAKNIVEICKTDFHTVTMFGDESEGLGFINAKTYLEQTAQKQL
jgi:replicative DNA helicase